MDKLDGIVLEVNTTCTDIAHSCLEPMHSLTATQCPILSARVRLMYTCKLVRIVSLPPTDLNIFVHVHFQMLLCKAADNLGPLDVSISEYGREIKDRIICPSIDKANCSCHRNSAAPTTDSAQTALCAETHSSRKMTRRGIPI